MDPTLLLLLIGSAISVLKSIPGVPNTVGTAIADVAGLIPSIEALVASGKAGTVNPTSILTMLSAIIAELQKSTNLNPGDLALAQAFDTAIQKALVADAAAQKVINPTLPDVEPLA